MGEPPVSGEEKTVTIEVREGRRGGLLFLVGGEEAVVTDHMRDNAPYLALKKLVHASRERKLVFRNVYEFLLELQRHVMQDSALWFVFDLMPKHIPDDLRKIGIIGDLRRLNAMEAMGQPDPLRAKLSLVPREVVSEVMRVRDMLEGSREYSVSIPELSGRNGTIVLEETFLVPTAVGFVECNYMYITPQGSAGVRCGEYDHSFDIGNMTLGDLITLTQAFKHLGRELQNKFMIEFTKNAPPVPDTLINRTATADLERTDDAVALAFHGILGELRGATMVLPVVTPDGVAWEGVKVRSTRFTGNAVIAYYKHGDYSGKAFFVPASDDDEYVEAMNEVLGRNGWLVERMRQNADAFMQFLRSYMEYLEEFRRYADTAIKGRRD